MRPFAALLLLAAACAAQEPSTSRDWLSRGIQAFKAARYAEAVTAFRNAADLDPANAEPLLYLGTAYMQQYIPGADIPSNQTLADQADAAFRKVLTFDPNNKVALASLGSLNLNRKNWEISRAAYKQLVNRDPENAEAYYSMAFIDWSEWYPAYSAARTKLGMAPAQPGPIPDPAVRADLRSQWWTTLEDGIWNLNRALEINPKYDDAMAYMNLFLRQRADLQETAQQYQQEVTEADRWVQKALDVKREKSDSLQRIRIAHTPELINNVAPVYPPLAKQARISGIVRLIATIDKQGHVINLSVESGHPLLVPAAIDAARQWTFQPTLLNGQPVEVLAPLEVHFNLQ